MQLRLLNVSKIVCSSTDLVSKVRRDDDKLRAKTQKDVCEAQSSWKFLASDWVRGIGDLPNRICKRNGGKKRS